MVYCQRSLTNSIHVKGGHGYGGLWGAVLQHSIIIYWLITVIVLHVCVAAVYSNRADMEQVDLCNNVIYNWSSEGLMGHKVVPII